jgi:hypothetical protein
MAKSGLPTESEHYLEYRHKNGKIEGKQPVRHFTIKEGDAGDVELRCAHLSNPRLNKQNKIIYNNKYTITNTKTYI